ncbi:MAG: fabH [Ilumatobacteraceae bacterium]|nr:fabH [Ilumatobacteraceae bacterium]
MSANHVFTHHNAGIISVTATEAPDVITSAWIDEQLADTYARTGVRPGLLRDLAGIVERRWWPEGMTFAEQAATAGSAALEASGVDPGRVGLMISTSVSRHHLEPSMACAIHHALRLPSSCANFDIANACLAFVNAIHVASTAIDAGDIEYALIVDGEGSRHTQEVTLERLRRPDVTAEQVSAEIATLTLGSGAAAMVLGKLDAHPDAHRIVGGVSRAATEHHDLCVGDLERMRTDTGRLLDAGLDLAEACWKASAERWDWSLGMDRYVVHQISQVHTRLMCERLGIDPTRVPLTFPYYGNVGPASIPITLASIADELTAGDRVLCMGIGSGLNASFTEVVW